MPDNNDRSVRLHSTDTGRRRFLESAGGGLLAAMYTGLSAVPTWLSARERRVIRWGIIGTGYIANQMAPMITMAPSAGPGAVSSRRMESALEFASQHGVERAFDSWEEMIAWDGIDAVYVATPTSLREEICMAAVNSGKHILGEKPFASYESVQRITTACRRHDLGFMDGTHFVHHPRTAHIRATLAELGGWSWSVDSAFQHNFITPDNIRMDPRLEPQGAIGDAGWYNMRAALEYLPRGIRIVDLESYLRRDAESGAVVSGSGVVRFDDGSTTTWNCGFDSGALVMDLRISSTQAVINMDDFMVHNPDSSAGYLLRSGVPGNTGQVKEIIVPADLPAAARMFEDFTALTLDKSLREQSMQDTLLTQQWLDAIWTAGLESED